VALRHGARASSRHARHRRPRGLGGRPPRHRGQRGRVLEPASAAGPWPWPADDGKGVGLRAAQPRPPAGRAILGILGVAAVGALLFDMLLLSRGLLVSFRALLDSAGLRRARDGGGRARPGPSRIADAEAAAAAIRALPDVDEVVSLRLGNATGTGSDGRRRRSSSWARTRRAAAARGSSSRTGSRRGRGEPSIVVNRQLAKAMGLRPGAEVTLRGDCTRGLPPPRHPCASGSRAWPRSPSTTPRP
jgi:hypothetical protein